MFAGIRADWSSPIRMWYRKRYDIVPDQSHYTATGLFQLFGLSSRRVGGLDTITALVTCIGTTEDPETARQTETHVWQLDWLLTSTLWRHCNCNCTRYTKRLKWNLVDHVSWLSDLRHGFMRGTVSCHLWALYVHDYLMVHSPKIH